MNPSSVLILEDTPATMEWLSNIVLEAFPAAVLFKASCLEDGRAACRQQTFDLALVDLGLPDGSGLELIEEIRGNVKSQTYIVVATIYDDDEHLLNALRLGANGYLLKDDSADKILQYLQGIEEARAPVSSRVLNQMMEHFKDAPSEPLIPLTTREEDVLRVIAKGYNVAESAELLNLSSNTVMGYLKTVYSKLNISSRAEATAEAIRRKLVEL